jgi:hypothetical protein
MKPDQTEGSENPIRQLGPVHQLDCAEILRGTRFYDLKIST